MPKTLTFKERLERGQIAIYVAALRTTFTGGRFLLATFAMNFVTVPAVVWVFS